MTTQDKNIHFAAKQMHASLCSELSSIGKANVGKKLEEADEYDRVKEIFTLMDLIEKEYGPINY